MPVVNSLFRCSLILYEETRFSYGHLCILSSEIILYWITLYFIILNSEFRNFKLWDQKLLFKGFVLKILADYF